MSPVLPCCPLLSDMESSLDSCPAVRGYQRPEIGHPIHQSLLQPAKTMGKLTGEGLLSGFIVLQEG